MHIGTATKEVSSRLLLIEEINFYNFEEQFQSFLDQNPEYTTLPVYVQFSQNIEMAIPELSIFIDSLKDMGVFISGLITSNKSTRRFASQLAIPSFSALRFRNLDKSTHDETSDNGSVHSINVVNNTSHNQSDENLIKPSSPSSEPNLTSQLQPPQHQPSPSLLTSQESHLSGSTTTKPEPQASPSSPPYVPIDPYQNKGLTQPDKQPAIIRENVKAGQNMRYDGDVIVLGEVDSGAIVSATGSIHCYNRVDGMLLAGSSGNSDARIYALKLNAEAVALSGYYAKRHQYKHILDKANLMISLDQSDLNFSVIKELPTIADLTTSAYQSVNVADHQSVAYQEQDNLPVNDISAATHQNQSLQSPPQSRLSAQDTRNTDGHINQSVDSSTEGHIEKRASSSETVSDDRRVDSIPYQDSMTYQAPPNLFDGTSEKITKMPSTQTPSAVPTPTTVQNQFPAIGQKEITSSITPPLGS